MAPDLTTTTWTPSPTTASRASRVRAFAAHRPVLTYLLLSFGLGWAFLMPPALAHSEALVLFVIPTALIAQLGAAVLVTAAADGRAGVRALLRRTFRWRVNPGWYALAALGLPVLAVAGATAVLGLDALRVAFAEPAGAIAFLTGLAIVPLINLWEETGWMGLVQTRLQDRHGGLVAALLTAPLFALIHLPLQIANPPAQVLVNMAILVGLAVPFRIVVGWLHNRTGSVLIAAVFHASFNVATSSVLFAALVPGQDALTITAVVLVLGAVAVVAVTRGRLSADR
jgi:membrane protease YdiL (CAAX protease family)